MLAAENEETLADQLRMAKAIAFLLFRGSSIPALMKMRNEPVIKIESGAISWR
ncbi:hypothetical protein [Laspinema olomoucense]|uniref:hypothetical protein n=1 Tax=Laspinema olomoucense TaxID=3231600 RepID=UPI0021BB873C|nr:hypothetical protein [Laspinema sp. D3a]MCT7992001.1 hypothetical protein [Laspinema sp. D3a]